MKKSKISNFLAKYNLGGIVEETIWTVEDNNLLIKFRTEDKSVMGVGLLKVIELQNSEFGVYSTSKMINAINPLDEDIKIELTVEDDTFTSLIFSDKDAINKRTLTKSSVIENTFQGFDLPEEVFDTVIKVDSNFLTKFNKIKNLDSDNIGIKINNDNTATFILNYSENNVDTGKFSIPIEKGNTTIKPILFKLDVISRILSVNKDFTSGTIKFCGEHGVLKFVFSSEDINFMYFTVALQ